MLNRRRAILATGSSILVAGRAISSAAAGPCELESSLADHDQQIAELLAASCLECAAACAQVMQRSAEIFSAAQDCRDLCIVTATLLSRPESTAPAICQACADACRRVRVACDKQSNSDGLQTCRESSEKCAQLCDFLLQKVS